MQNNNPNDYLQQDEITLKEMFMLLINSKKLIITITLIITTLGAIYSFQKVPKYESSALIEIGQYDTFEEENILLESAPELIQNLNIVFIHKSKDNESLSIKTIEGKLIKIKIHKFSIEEGKKTLDQIAKYIENRHSLLLSNSTQKAENQLTYKIKSLNNQIEHSKSALLTQNEDEKLRISNQIESLNSELPSLDTTIELLNEIIVADQNNLLLLKSNAELFIQRAAQSPTLDQIIFSYKGKLIDYENEKIKLSSQKDTLETQLMILESNDLVSDEVFKLSQEKDKLELELEFLTNQNPNSTQLIGEIVIRDISTKKELIILLSFIFGLFLSIMLVFINNFYKAFKEYQV
jgi:LPS O-antigen subunit length determinant protein (WzzB/FepE family)